MRNWRQRAGATALVICLSSSFAGFGEALAADLSGGAPSLKDAPLPEPAAASWEGLYVGGHVGGAWTTTTVDDKYDYVGDPSSTNTVSGSDVIGGGQIGYNFQWGHFVFGPEIDLGYLGLSGSKSAALTRSPGCLANYGANVCGLNAGYQTSGGFYGDITGRLGYAMDNVLFYAKGGVAFLDTDIKANYVGQNCSTAHNCWLHPNAPVNYSNFNFGESDTLWGWTVGGGVEYALNQNWSIKVEYQHFDFGSTSFKYDGDFSIPGTPWHSKLNGSAEFSPTVDSVMVGVNYHLDLFSSLK